MRRHDYEPGSWSRALELGDLPRLRALACRRLVGYEHFADDVVANALIRWTDIPAHKREARLEQVIKSAALSLLRSERRSRHREDRVYNDRANSVLGSPGVDAADVVTLRLAIEQTCESEGIEITDVDRDVLNLLFSGYNVSEIVRESGLTRHTVRQSRLKWQEIMALMELGTRSR